MLVASLCSSSMTSGLGSGRVEEAWVSTKAVLLAANTTLGRDVATGLHRAQHNRGRGSSASTTYSCRC
jgi:hypothetical protein